MSINGINNYKVNTVSNPDQEDWKAETASTDSTVEDSYESSGETSSLDDYTNGEYVDGSLASENELDPEGMYNLDTFMPTVDEVILQRPESINHLDLLDAKYAQSMEDLTALKKNYQDTINAGQLTREETESLVMKMELIDAAMAKGEAQRARCAELATGLAAEYLEELRTCTLIGTDNWIGRPYEAGSVYKHVRDDGTEIWLDHEGKPTLLPILDPDYQASITASSTMKLADSNDILGSAYPAEAVDRVITFDGENALSNDNYFGCPISLGIPRCFWVRKADDASDGMGNDYATIGIDGEYKAELYDQWSSDGMTQLTPEDMSQYMQVKVTEVEIVSEPLDYLVEGNDGENVYDHYVVYKNGDNVLARIRITGNIPDATSDAGVVTNLEAIGGGESVHYIAASSVGFELVGDNQDVAVDATSFISTGRHIVGDLASKLGIEEPSDEQAKRAFDENVGFFTDKSWNISQWDPEEQEWKSAEDGPITDFDGTSSYSYGDYDDRYLSRTEDVSSESPVSSYQTGIFMTGVRGKIKGSAQSDVIQCHGANDLSDYDKENLPDDDQNRVSGDAFYSNLVDGNGGNNVFVGGSGDNIVDNVTFAWLKDGGHNDENWIGFPDRPSVQDGYEVENLPNQKCFFHGEGGTNNIYNPDEYDYSEDQGEDPDGDDQGQFAKANASDDYYECPSGSMNFGNPDDPNIDGAHGSCTFDETTIPEIWKLAEEEWDEAILSVPGEEYLDEISDEWSTMFDEESKSALDEEMDSFFDEAFGSFSDSFDFDTEL